MKQNETSKYQNAGLDIVTVTDSSEVALAGFKSFSEAEAFARNNDLRVVTLHRNAVWEAWEEYGIDKPLTITADDYGDAHAIYDNLDEFDAQSKDLACDSINNYGLKASSDLIDKLITIHDTIESLNEDERCVVNIESFTVVDIISYDDAKWSMGGTTYMIAVM